MRYSFFVDIDDERVKISIKPDEESGFNISIESDSFSSVKKVSTMAEVNRFVISAISGKNITQKID